MDTETLLRCILQGENTLTYIR